ncbi:hypothetical protein QG37_04580 [Candidozyma auris]|nr:hypothetical protein QG37_04580 [[Candida] auris]
MCYLWELSLSKIWGDRWDKTRMGLREGIVYRHMSQEKQMQLLKE